MHKVSSFFLVLYLLTQGAFLCPDEEDCRYCYKDVSDQYICGLCENSFYDPDGKMCSKKFDAIVEDCQLYEQDPVTKKTYCQSCNLGFRLSDNKSCKRCSTDGCAKCEENDICTACFDRRFPDDKNNICKKEVQCDLPNCDICLQRDGHIKCEACHQGFALNNLQERLCAMSNEGCYLIDSIDSTKCLACQPGYFVTKDRTCTPNSRHNMLLVAIIVFFLSILLVGSGYFFYQRSKSNQARIEIYNSI
jgi:hypothetical protein